MRALLLDGPAYIVTHIPAAVAWLWRAYWLLIAALSILCLVTAVLTWLLWWLGVPIPLPPPLPLTPPTINAAAH